MANRILGRHPERVIIITIGLLVVLNLAFLIGRNSDTSEPGTDALPSTVESVSPEPGTQADRRIAVSVDLRDDLTGVLFIDGQRIPEDQLEYIDAQGIITFRPGADTDLSAFEAGDHTVLVLYWPQTENEPEEPDTFGWSFRATA